MACMLFPALGRVLHERHERLGWARSPAVGDCGPWVRVPPAHEHTPIQHAHCMWQPGVTGACACMRAGRWPPAAVRPQIKPREARRRPGGQQQRRRGRGDDATRQAAATAQATHRGGRQAAADRRPPRPRPKPAQPRASRRPAIKLGAYRVAKQGGWVGVGGAGVGIGLALAHCTHRATNVLLNIIVHAGARRR